MAPIDGTWPSSGLCNFLKSRIIQQTTIGYVSTKTFFDGHNNNNNFLLQDRLGYESQKTKWRLWSIPGQSSAYVILLNYK